MSRWIRRVARFALLVVPIAASAQRATCAGCLLAKYWEVDPDYWKSPGPPVFPEFAIMDTTQTRDFGLAFSGGGTRSASATLGQLRALEKNGWLSRVRFIAAVSGGSWAAVPYIYYDGPLDGLLGKVIPVDTANVRVPNGLLASRIAASSLTASGLWEAPNLLPAFLPDGQKTISGQLKSIAAGAQAIRKNRKVAEPNRTNKSYAHVLGSVFLNGLIKGATTLPYAANEDVATEMAIAAQQPRGQFVFPPPGRPFLIVGGTLVKPALDYPRLVPVEYTPLYTGVRQQFGTIGGTYIWPWAYDRQVVGAETAERVRVFPGPTGRTFTLADVIASSGAAPQLALLTGLIVPGFARPVAKEAADIFPAFTNITVRNGEPNAPSAELPHGDGGFVDNLAIMPLIARQVRNIIVFVNSSSEYPDNSDLESYFVSLKAQTGSGEKSMNAVFDESLYGEVLKGLGREARPGHAAVYCGTNWKVRANPTYNTREYGGLNICWVYNFAPSDWTQTLPDEIQRWLSSASGKRKGNAKKLENFPYYATFLQNKVHLIQLEPLQVNLLADLSAWTLTNSRSMSTIMNAMPSVFRAP